jgi:hypothetical protein
VIESGTRHRACRDAHSAPDSYLAGRQAIKAIRSEILGFLPPAWPAVRPAAATRPTCDSAGGVHLFIHFQPQGISGVGSPSGDTYHGTGVTQQELNAKVGLETTFINRFDIVGQEGTAFEVHDTFHITFNANGTVTAFVDNVSVVCRQ